jgi:hypothetical protein
MGNDEQALTVKTICDWSEVNHMCTTLSALLDRFDEDRFAYLLRYGSG